MPYYQGDLRARGDFYAMGDPGLMSFLGKAVGFGKGLLGIGTRLSPVGMATAATTGIVRRVGGALSRGVIQHPVLTAAGAAGIVGAAAGAGAEAMRMGVSAVGKGFHMTRPQRTPRRPEPHLARNRRMKPGNTKALHRALRRAYSFQRLAMRVIRLTHPRKRGRFAGFKARRRKAA